ncbi:hypothetical protein H8K90_08785 [Winogradskyella echinorum]|uniref:Uncharacterized protein n=1 Tax=Winogradskyella echinorum TaxID=538189 RepID=A0ABR6Y187_9FLAO|nr:hypothetical protein [Winogradskyella echinorum]MBC3846473.1 hypothetical protein [Winogradskyella echinorum]MBC5750821.1 hypothetical protein [Winogradskyella echinorum]
MSLPNRFEDTYLDFTENVFKSNKSSIISKVSTKPLKSGGASFKTNVLVEKSSSKYVYKPSIGAALFSFIFLAVGLGVLFYGLFPLFKSNYETTSINWFLLVFGLIFSSAGGVLFFNFYKPRVFDKQLGVYYKAYNVDIHKIRKDTSNKYIILKSIVALQIIGEHVKSDKGSYKSFELNLVLEDASRKNVVDHGNLKSIIDDAHVLSQFLNVPIWHAKSNDDQ